MGSLIISLAVAMVFGTIAWTTLGLLWGILTYAASGAAALLLIAFVRFARSQKSTQAFSRADLGKPIRADRGS